MNKNSNLNNNTLLDRIDLPSDLKKLDISQLKILKQELRSKTIETVSKIGGHLGAGLGVIELTIALHYIFDAPKDKIIWDTGHQSYPHKILTGRKNRIDTIRQPGGISGFTKRKESEYDVFGTGHSSTSISAGIGFCLARDLSSEKYNVISIIGDGAISAGMAYEALNNAGELKTKLIVILNDNNMSISPAVGAMSNYLSKISSSKNYIKFNNFSKKISKKLPDSFYHHISKLKNNIKNICNRDSIFDKMGFKHIGPIDGHNLDMLLAILQNVKENEDDRPILLHIVTKKGYGCEEINPSEDKLHAVSKFNIKDGKIIQSNKTNNKKTYSQIFSENLCKIAEKDEKIIAITAAMSSGTGLDVFKEKFSNRFFDVGIAEQHATTFAAGLACSNFKPFLAIYSTFLQRAYDQIVHDIAIQNLPVRIAIDRAGFVGADGPTHAGSFDISYLINLPNFILMSPKDGNELVEMLLTAYNIDDRPSALRYPKDISDIDLDISDAKPIEIGKGEILQKGEDFAILFYGTSYNRVRNAANFLKDKHQINLTLVNARFAKPLDELLISQIARDHKVILTIEDGVLGGFGSAVNNFLIQNKFLDNGKLAIRNLFMKDEFIEQNSVNKMQEESGIGEESIIENILQFHK